MEEPKPFKFKPFQVRAGPANDYFVLSIFASHVNRDLLSEVARKETVDYKKPEDPAKLKDWNTLSVLSTTSTRAADSSCSSDTLSSINSRTSVGVHWSWEEDSRGLPAFTRLLDSDQGKVEEDLLEVGKSQDLRPHCVNGEAHQRVHTWLGGWSESSQALNQVSEGLSDWGGVKLRPKYKPRMFLNCHATLKWSPFWRLLALFYDIWLIEFK